MKILSNEKLQIGFNLFLSKINCFLLLLALVITIQSEATYCQEVTVSIQHPPYNQLKIEDMWKITLINTSSTTLTVNLKGTLTETDAGLIATGESKIFELPPGRKVFTGAY